MPGRTATSWKIMRVLLAESNIWREAVPRWATLRLTVASPWLCEACQLSQPTSPASNPGLTSPAAGGGRVVVVVLVAVLSVVVVVVVTGTVPRVNRSLRSCAVAASPSHGNRGGTTPKISCSVRTVEGCE
jgi:hypothetical protein